MTEQTPLPQRGTRRQPYCLTIRSGHPCQEPTDNELAVTPASWLDLRDAQDAVAESVAELILFAVKELRKEHQQSKEEIVAKVENLIEKLWADLLRQLQALEQKGEARLAETKFESDQTVKGMRSSFEHTLTQLRAIVENMPQPQIVNQIPESPAPTVVNKLPETPVSIQLNMPARKVRREVEYCPHTGRPKAINEVEQPITKD